jgi:hypothetical protein
VLLLSHPRHNVLNFCVSGFRGGGWSAQSFDPYLHPPKLPHPALGGGHLSFTPESGSSESLASGIVDFSAFPCHRVVPLGLCPPRRTLGLSLSRAPAIPAKRRTGDSESRRINAARRFTRVPFRKNLSIILVFPHTQGTPALRNGPSGEAARS